MGDHTGKADRVCGPVAPVDRVEVARGAGVPDQVGPGHAVRLGFEHLASLESRGRHARTTRRAQMDTTGSPVSVVMSTRVVRNSFPARAMISSTWHDAASRSPARTGRPSP